MKVVQSCEKFLVSNIESLQKTGVSWMIPFIMDVCLSLYSNLMDQSSIIKSIYTGRVSYKLTFSILTLFVVLLSSGGPSESFWHFRQRTGAGGQVVWDQKYLCSKTLSGDCQPHCQILICSDMIIVVLLLFFWFVISKSDKWFSWANECCTYVFMET